MKTTILCIFVFFAACAMAQVSNPPLPPPGADGGCLVTSGGKWVRGACSGGAVSFAALTSGTNTTAAFLIGTGASLGVTGSGTITATGTSASPTTCSPGSFANGINSDFSASGCAAPTLAAPFITSSANPAASGVLRCANGDVCFAIRNGTNSGDYTMTADSTGFILSAPLKINSSGASNYTAIADPGSPATGDFWYSSTTAGRFKWYNGAAIRTFMNTSDSVLAAQMPALTGAVTSSAGAVATSPGKTDVLQTSGYCVDAGANDTYTCNLSPAISAYVTGTTYRFQANTANTGAATINFNSIGALTIKKVQGAITTDLADNDIRVGQWVNCVYDGTNCQMTSQLGNAPAGSGTVNSGTATHLGYYAGTGTAISDMGADYTFNTHTLVGGASAILDMSAAPATTGLKIPVAAGAAPTVDGQIAVNSTNHHLEMGSNGSTIDLNASSGSSTSFLKLSSGAVGVISASSSYYIGDNNLSLGAQVITNPTVWMPAPKALTITRVTGSCFNTAATTGLGGDATIDLCVNASGSNNCAGGTSGASANVASSVTWPVNFSSASYDSTAISVAVSAADKIAIRIKSGTWSATAPSLACGFELTVQ